MGLVVTAIGAGILAYVVTWFMREIVFYRGPPRDLPFPIVGHLPWLIKYTSRYAFHDFLGDLSHRYGDISAFTLFGSSFVTIERASEAKRILTSNNFGRGDLLQSMFSGLLSFALFLLPSNDGLWKKHRKWIQPAFGPANVRFTLDASNTVMHRVEGFLDQLINDTPDAILKSLDMAHLSSLITLDIIGRVAFSRDLKNVEALQTLKKTETAELTGKIAMIVEEVCPCFGGLL